MTDDRKKRFFAFTLAFAAAAAVLDVFVLVRSAGVFDVIAAVLSIAALIPAVIYAAKVFSKSAAKAYTFFMAFYAAAELVALVNALIIAAGTGNPKTFVAISSSVIAFGVLCVIIFAKDLGSENSFAAGCSLTAFKLIGLVSAALTGGFHSAALLSSGAQLCISCIMVVMIAAKYADKKSRGRPQ